MKTWIVEKTVSKGYAIGPAYVVKKRNLTINLNKISEEQVYEEMNRFDKAVTSVKKDLELLAKDSEIFEAHIALVEDIALRNSVMEKIKNQLKNAEHALKETCDEYVMIFESVEDEYLRERSADMKDIFERLICELKGINENPFAQMQVKSLVVAEDLAPSDTVKMNMDLVLGIVTERGGVTSHVSIIAKNMAIPCLVGVGKIIEDIQTGNSMIIDAKDGKVFLNPDQEITKKYEQLAKEFKETEQELEKLSNLPSVTKDGKTFELHANAGNIEDIKNAVNYQIDGIGLLRSEFLYMENSHFPTEEEQFASYKKAALQLKGKEVTIRTLDIGGDKGLDYYEFPKEENPFLGYRAIRISLDQPELLKTQMRALLRASAFGNIRIMYPMIVSLEELREANTILAKCKEELSREKHTFNENIKVGMMIETPAAVMMAEEFAKEVDFFSIGTNDLTQYFLAVDRGNQKISYLYNSYNPAVLRAIHNTIQAGHKHDVKIGMCGEFASDAKAAVMLLGMGLDEFSMSASEIARVKYQLRQCSYQEAKLLAENVICKVTIEEVLSLLR